MEIVWIYYGFSEYAIANYILWVRFTIFSSDISMQVIQILGNDQMDTISFNLTHLSNGELGSNSTVVTVNRSNGRN
jgi:hypothetical protein